MNHTISRRIVNSTVHMAQTIACEDLTHIRERTNTQPRSKTERRRSNSWAFAQLRAFLSYKCVMAGVPFVLVNPRSTSQWCHVCLHMGERSGKRFVCVHPGCQWSGDADYNGACNIALLGAAVTSPGGPSLCCVLEHGGRASESPALKGGDVYV